MVTDTERGIYNLRIRDVALDDEGDFQCQVMNLVPLMSLSRDFHSICMSMSRLRRLRRLLCAHSIKRFERRNRATLL